MAAEAEWVLSEDGCLCVNGSICNINYHPNLNVIFVISKDSSVKVLDACSGTVLQTSNLSASPKSQVQCKYIPGHDKVLFTDGKAVGLRRDHNGVLLLDTILQTRVEASNEVVKIELLLSEATQLWRCLKELDVLGGDNTSEVLAELENKIRLSETLAKVNHKVEKWCTVCLELPLGTLKSVFSGLVQELKRLNRCVPSLSIASAVTERLNSLLLPPATAEPSQSGVATVDRSLMFSEFARRETFGKWPHMNYKWAQPEQMAQAGFYHQSNSTGDDRAMCFTCNICLVCWEPTDEPWSEHERHSPTCPYVKGEYTQNVPLSITYATSPALLHSERQERISCMSTSNFPDLIATATESGSVVVWNVSQSLKKEFNFIVNPRDPYILSAVLTRQKRCRASLEKEGWTVFCGPKGEGDDKTKNSPMPSHEDDNDLEKLLVNRVKDDVRVMALSVFGSWRTSRTDTPKSNDVLIDSKPSIVVGASIDTPSALMSRPGSCKEENLLVQVLNDANQISCSSKSLDIMKMDSGKNDSEEEVINSGSSKGGSNTRSVRISPGLYLLHYSLGKRRSRRATLTGNVAASSSSSSKVTSGVQREANRLFYQSLGVLLNDDALECPYDLNPYAAPQLVQTNDLKFNVYSMDHLVEDMCDIVSATDSGYALLESESEDVESLQARSLKTDVNEDFACSRAVECLELPGNFSGDTHSITHIVPTHDNRHALVIVGLRSHFGQNCNLNSKPVGAIFLYQLECLEDGVVLVESPILQRTLVDLDDVIVDVVFFPKEVGEVKEDVLNGMKLHVREELPSTSSQEGPHEYIAVVTRAGCVQLITLSTLEIVGELKPCSASPYVAAVYCSSIERLCVCTSDGTLRLLQLRPKTRDVGMSNSPLVRFVDFIGPAASDTPGSSVTANRGKMEDEATELSSSLVHLPLTLPVLTRLHQLTEFMNLTPRFTATLPACWMEIQQEQKQRRHPQHLQQQGKPNQHTRSWRLQSDGSSWNEHLFEISLPRSCCIGHIDFKFSLHPSFSSLPNIQATLLKQNTGGIVKKDASDEGSIKHPIMSSTSCKSKSCVDQENPVLSREFLDTHNAEILCGPLSLASYLDLSCQSGIVTFTSPKLMETKSRTFIIHLKALRNGEDKLQLRHQLQQSGKRETSAAGWPTMGWTQVTKPPPLLVQNLMKMQDKHGPVPSLQSLLEYYVPSGSTIDLLTESTPSWKTEVVRGCDLLHEISITVRMAKKLNIGNERSQRLAMLTNVSFHERLLIALCSKEPLSDDITVEHQQHLILDILNWIVAIQANKPDEGCVGESCIFIKIQTYLNSIIRCCYLDTSRSIAHKCSKLIIMCLEYTRDYKVSSFKTDLAKAVLDVLPLVVSCRTAGAMRWFFLLLDRIKFLDGSSAVGNRCLAMLVAVVRELDTRVDPYHAILRTRFGLGRNPFEPDLFEIEAPLPPEPTSTPVTYAAVVGNGGSGGGGGGGGGSIGVGTSSGVNNNNNSSSNGLFGTGGVSASSGVGSTATSGLLGRCGSTPLNDDGRGTFSAFSPPTHHLRGLLEVEPLHFVCHAASDGTKVERVESGSSSGTGNPLVLSPNATIYVPSSSGTRQMPHSHHESKKPDEVLHKFSNVKMNTYSASPGGSVSSVPTSSPFSSSSSSSSSSSFKNDKEHGGPLDAGSITGVPISPWQHFLQPPPQQALVIERMHSGARRFVVLDFGKSILLTDLIIPACPDLVSLSVDIWTEGEEIDGQRLVVSTDIWCLSLVMNDLLPPPTCRFLKITVIGRYGMSPTRCRIPLGTFYGHTVVPPWLHVLNSEHSEEPITQLQTHLNVLSLLLEDIHCRYSLSCDKLRSLLGPLLAMERPASAHIQAFIRRERGKVDVDEQRIFAIYRDCIQLQQQLNLTVATAERLRRTMVPTHGSLLKSSLLETDKDECNLSRICTDKLLVLGECLLVALLGMTYSSSMLAAPTVASSSSLQSNIVPTNLDHATCELLFRHSAIVGSSRFQVLVNTLMVRSCGLEPWWGSFVAKMIVELYRSNQTVIFPQDRVFLLLVSCHDKSFLNNTVPSVLELLQDLLAPIVEADGILEGVVDVSLVGWVLLFISFYMDIAENGSQIVSGEDMDEGAKTAGSGARRRSGTSRWDFVQEEWAMLRNRSSRTKLASHRLCRRKLQKRLMYHKQQLEDLEQVKKSYLPNNAYSTLKSHFGSKMAMDLDAAVKKVIKQHTAKHFKDIVLIRRSEGSDLSHLDGGESSTSSDLNQSSKDYNDASNVCGPSFCLPRSQALRVAHGLATLLLTMDYSCNVDVFLLACKVLAKLATIARPAIGLGEIIDQSHLEKLLLRCVRIQGISVGSHGWGGPWATHAITCLLQDILEGEKLYPILKRSPQERNSITTDLGIDNLGSPDHPSSVMVDLPKEGTTEADKSTISFGSNGNLAGLMKILDADSDETSSDDAAAESVEAFPSVEKFSMKKTWANADGSTTSAPLLSIKDDNMSDDVSFDVVSFPVVSTAIDSRLELGVDVKSELRLKTMILGETKVLFDAFFGPLTPPIDVCVSQHASPSNDVPLDPVFPLSFSSQITSSSVDMLAICFDRLFGVHGLDLESLLHLWVTLNEATSDVVGRVLPLSMGVASGILASLVWHPTLSLRTWYLAFQTLQSQPWKRGDSPDMSSRHVSFETGVGTDTGDPMSSMLCNLLPVLLKFLSGSGLENSFLCKSNVGPSVTSAMCAFLKRLFMVCDNPPVNIRTVVHLKEQLLRTVYLLVNSSGPVRDGRGPLDAQYCLVNFLHTINFNGTDRYLRTSVVEAVSSLVHVLIQSSHRVTSRSSTESEASDATCFGGILSVLPRADSSGATVEVTQSTLIHALLSFCVQLVKSFGCSGVTQYPSSPLDRHQSQRHSPATSMTDTLKIEQKTAETSTTTNTISTTTTTTTTTDHLTHGSVLETDELKSAASSGNVSAACTHSHALSPSPKQEYIADEVLKSQPTMMWLLQSLSACTGSPIAMLLGPMGVGVSAPGSDGADGFFLGEPVSVGDVVFKLLCTLNACASKMELILQPILSFLSSGGSEITGIGNSVGPCMSEPLLWLIIRILDCERTISEFVALGGIQVICRNLVGSHRQQVNGQPSLLSIVLQKVNRIMAPGAKDSSWPEWDGVDGLVNFAPLGIITLKDPTIQPADVLIQPTPPHRRARTPAWSYHFYPEEAWVDLTITLPCAILLREVHIQPHLTSLATCPSAVALEISRDGAFRPRPLGLPRPTAGLTFIRLQLTQPEVATSVVVRLYKPRDSSNIGLSQIILLGTSAFGDASGTNGSERVPSVPTEEGVAKSSVGWLRLLHHCLMQPSSRDVQKRLCTDAAAVPGLLATCCSLLLTPVPESYAAHVESVLLYLGRSNPRVGLQIVDTLLTTCSSPFGQGAWSHAIGITQSSVMMMDSVMDVVFSLCTTLDTGTADRIGVLLSWMSFSAQKALNQWSEKDANAMPAVEEPHGIPEHMFICCISAILWNLHESGFCHELAEMLSTDLLRLLYEWACSLAPNSSMRRSVHSVLSSYCYIRPDCFTSLLQWMGFLPDCSPVREYDLDEDYGAPITDDSKESGGYQSKDLDSSSKPSIAILETGTLRLNINYLTTLASASQSPPAISRLIESGLPQVLAQAILDFCICERPDCAWQTPSHPKCHHEEKVMTDADKVSQHRHTSGTKRLLPETVTAILDFFTELCMEGSMRDWLGGPEGSIFWLPLLEFLCLPLSCVLGSSFNSQTVADVQLSTRQRSSLEAATVRFLSHCCWCHPDNQQLLSQVLCEVIGKQAAFHRGGFGILRSITGFARQLILQLLLESEKILVYVTSSIGSCGGQNNQHRLPAYGISRHPRFGSGHHFRLLYLGIRTTCSEILQIVTSESGALPLAPPSSDSRDRHERSLRDLGSMGLELADCLSVAAGVLAKDKRHKESKSSSSVPSKSISVMPNKMWAQASSIASGPLVQSSLELTHELLPDQPLPGRFTLAQLLSLLKDRGHSLGCPYVTLALHHSGKSRSDTSCLRSPEEVLLAYDTFPSALQVFASVGGLALLAPYLPVLYPDGGKQQIPVLKTSNDKAVGDLGSAADGDWVKVDAPDDIFDDFPELLHPGTSSSRPSRNNQLSFSVPPHSLAAFGLFLRLPGYAETLLKERQKAQCLLRLALGVTDDGEGGDIFTSPVSHTLPTLPFKVLQQLFDSTPLTTDDGVLLRRMALDVGAVHLLLSCLSILSHQSVDLPMTGIQPEFILPVARINSRSQDSQQSKSDDKSHLYWAKGTGFGTGSTTQSWDVEQAISKQKSEEEHVTCLLQVLASYINPRGNIPYDLLIAGEDNHIWLEEDSDGDDIQDGSNSGEPTSGTEAPQALLPSVFPELLAQSCVFATISSYLRNDSVLDMARHVPLYRALLQLLRAMAVSGQLVGLLLPPIEKQGGNSTSGLSVCCLLTKMRSCVDTYDSRLRSNKTNGLRTSSKLSAGGVGKTKEEEESEGLAMLIPDVQETARIVDTATARLLADSRGHGSEKLDRVQESVEPPMMDHPIQKTADERYLEVMKRLQFDTFEMIVEDDDGIRFTVPHHFESNMRAAGDHGHPSRARRLAQEAVTISTSLPLSYSSSVFVRCDQDRLDLMKVLITGPADTPYANGCFEFDVYFPPDYPNSPMLINLETTGHHTVRFNPNLYNDGKVCLSILNTWHGRPEEKWNPQTSSFLQVLVSIQSLILVQEPYFNEPGYERSRGTPSGQQSSREYDSNIRQATVKWAMLEQLRNTGSCFKEVIRRHFWMKRVEIMDQCQRWIHEMEAQGSDRRTGRTVAVNCQALKRHFAQLMEELSRMSPPPGLEDFIECIDWRESSMTVASTSQNDCSPSPPPKNVVTPQINKDELVENAVSDVSGSTAAVGEASTSDSENLSSHQSRATSFVCGPV